MSVCDKFIRKKLVWQS